MDDTQEWPVWAWYRSLAIAEEIWVEKMYEKSSKITDFACLGRSTQLSERFRVEISGFC